MSLCAYRSHFVTFTLQGCLYAPTAPINLLSVGALAEQGMSCLFSPGGITKVFYSDDHPRLPGFSFEASVVNRLSFLNLNFVASPASLVSVALPVSHPVPSNSSAYSFPRVTQTSMLWHRRFGHIGMEATHATLTKDYVTGVQLEGPFLFMITVFLAWLVRVLSVPILCMDIALQRLVNCFTWIYVDLSLFRDLVVKNIFSTFWMTSLTGDSPSGSDSRVMPLRIILRRKLSCFGRIQPLFCLFGVGVNWSSLLDEWVIILQLKVLFCNGPWPMLINKTVKVNTIFEL